MTDLIRIENPLLRRVLPLVLGGAVLVVFVYALIQGGSATGWAGWAIGAGFAIVLFLEYRRQSTGEPFLLASETGVWIKDLDCLGEIPWTAIADIRRPAFSRRIDLHLVERRRWLERLTFWRIGHSVGLAAMGKIGFSVRFTGARPDDVAAALHAIWTERKEAR